MKLLLDQNISYKLIKPLSKLYEEVVQISRLGMGQTSDSMVWQYALTYGYTMVTYDAYFVERNALTGYPIKVLWLKCEDTSTENVLRLLSENYETITQFHEDDTKSCLEIIC
jgi:predicted nuclease of predicted toxin-antitoxin system